MASNCPHIHELSSFKSPRLSQSVHREECTQCFDNQDSTLGVDVCLTCFNGSCLDQDRHHSRTHVLRSGHTFTLNVKRLPKQKPSIRGEGEEPPAKMKKIAIAEEREEDKYTHITTIKCWKCDPQNGTPITTDSITTKTVSDGVMFSLSSARQSEVKAWEEEITACGHTLMLEQISSGPIPAEGLAHCVSCELTSNLWLCLTCRALGCGRAQFGGVGGNGHALDHFNKTGHAVCVKLGTITPEGGADIYCYACNDARIDPELTSHLSTFGINVSVLSKTEKSMTELQIEQNLTFDFSLTAEDGSALQPVFGPGTTGLSNLGNSCYMASVLQTLFALPAFQSRYFGSIPPESASTSSPKAATHWLTCAQALPAECVECQMLKLADGLLSGRYSVPHGSNQSQSQDPLAHPAPENTPWQAGLKPAGFKALVGRGHAEFATMRQQDAEEFLSHFLTVLRRFNHQAQGADANADAEPTETFAFGLEQRLECQECHRVRYRIDNMDVLSLGVPAVELPADTEDDASNKKKYAPVELLACLGMLVGPTGEESLEYQCEAGCGKTNAVRRTQFATFPEVLVLHAKKFQLVNWVPTKLDIPVLLPSGDILTLDTYVGHGLQAGEIELPNVNAGAPQAIQFDPDTMAQLEGMGFPTIRCQKAILATGNSGAETAMEWLFGHMEDPDIDDPIPTPGSSPSGPEPSEGEIAMLSDMGFTNAQAKKALRETAGNIERAVEWLFNHPDDNGDDTSSRKDTQPKPPPGSTRLPARYRLKAFISHKGPSVHSGHYVAHIRIRQVDNADAMDVDNGEGKWVLFNDEKVVLADKTSVEELKKLAYLYVFERV
ncbi:hypothetical protein BJ138DRAFT_1149823 [Hygrophoropsis aurantiaca]|uniref:Uncharacterized protein n=1 Tax=Hygrophoropsis aurantiaca TaxID=72124 RepID=A0ACB8AEM0_9AGAM|nr:hypothetical protein BJ138DRAFT_1149823 [Hygrophoropsis aurantiaca]